MAQETAAGGKVMARLAAMLAAALALSGCLKVEGEVRIGEDGAGRMAVTLALKRNVFAMLPQDKRFAFCDLGEMAKVLGEPEVRLAGDYVQCSYERAFPHIGYVDTPAVRAVELADGQWRLTLRVKEMLANTALARALKQRQRKDGGWQQAALPMMLREARITVRVVAPHITRANGRIEKSQDGKGQVAVWEGPLAPLLGIEAQRARAAGGFPLPFAMMAPAPAKPAAGKPRQEQKPLPEVFEARFWCRESWFFGSPTC